MQNERRTTHVHSSEMLKWGKSILGGGLRIGITCGINILLKNWVFGQWLNLAFLSHIPDSQVEFKKGNR